MAKKEAEVMEEKQKKSPTELVMEEMNKKYGKGTVVGANTKATVMDSVSTGSLGIDLATGIGGLPYGRVVEILGPESCGKTTICLSTIANAQKQGKKCAYIDMEHALDFGYAEDLQVNLDEMIISQPDYGEAALDIAISLIKAGEVKVVVIDSVASLVTKGELEGTVGDVKIAPIARLMSQSMRMMVGSAEKHGCLVIFTNQLRESPGVMYGSPERPTGGNALKFYASIRIDLRKTADAENSLNKTRVKIIKNKCSSPFKTCEVQLIWGRGFNQEGEIIELAVDLEIIQKSGSWFAYGDSKIGQGIAAVEQFLTDNPEFREEIKYKVMEAIKSV